MKKNAKYTAEEILAEAEIKAEVGKKLVNIAGINISKTNQIIKLQNVEKIVVAGGGEKKEIVLEENEQTFISDGVKKELENK